MSLSFLPDPSNNPTIYLAIAGVVLVLVIAQRVSLVRRLINLAVTIALAGLLVLAVSQRTRFDPYFSHIASMLKLNDQAVVGKEVRIRMAPDGHFWAWVSLDGVRRRMLIDSGATVTALSSDTARAAHLKVEDEIFPIILRTANGSISAQSATVKTLTLGNVVARDIPVVVSPAFGDTDVIGMNFLSKLKSWRVDDNTLVLVPHHPQEPSDTAA